MRILIRRYAGGLGDQVCCTVAIRAARELYPDAEIVVAVGERYHSFVFGQSLAIGCQDCISPDAWDTKGDDAFILQYALNTFDRVINLDGPEVEHAHESNWKLTKNRIEVWCDTVGFQPKDMRPRLHVDARDRLRVFRKLQAAGLDPFGYVVLQWSSAECWKDYPVAHRISLVESLQARGIKVIIAHNREVPDLGVWCTHDKHGGFSFTDLGILCELASCVICPDSALLHLAAAVDTPSVGLFSGTDGTLTCKYYPLTYALQNRDVAGKQCENTFPCYGRDENNFWCAKRGDESYIPWCLEQITPYQVMMAMDRLLDIDMSEKQSRVLTAIHYEANVKIDRTQFASKKKVLIAGVPPGIGDSLWAMTKARAIMKEDSCDGLVVCMQKTQPARGREFVRRLKFVDACEYFDMPIHPLGGSHINPDGTYNYMPTQRNYLGMDWLWIPNAPLERGEPLENWLAEYSIDWRVLLDDFVFTDADEQVASAIESRVGSPFVVFFMGSKDANTRAGHNRAQSYTKEDWKRFGYLDSLYDGVDPRSPWRMSDWLDIGRKIVWSGLSVVIVGARYDAEYARDFVQLWSESGLDKSRLVNICGSTQIAETYAVCRRARCIVGYQSGIPIACSFFGIPTVVFWRAHGDSLEPTTNRLVTFSESMRENWAPPWMKPHSFIGEIYARRSPTMIFDEMCEKKFFEADRPRGRDLVQ